MLRIVIAANLLLTALAVGDLAFWIKRASEGKQKVECKLICQNVYGNGRWGRGWKRGGAKCTCGSLAKIDITCTASKPYSGCTGTQTGGSMTPPPAVDQQPPAGLANFIVECAEAAVDKYAQRNGKVTTTKVLSGVGDAQCSDLAMGCIHNANVKGYNVWRGKRGNVYNMRGSWAWSKEVVPFESAKAGDIAQFSSWKETGRWTGPKHTAVIVKDYDPTTGELATLDQNPSPTKHSAYHPKNKKGGKLMVYRLKSVPLDGWPMADGTTPAAASASSAAAPAAAAPAAAAPAAAAPAAAACKDHHDMLVKLAADEPNPPTSCADAKPVCKNPEYGPVVSDVCPVTCGSCGVCKDHHHLLAKASSGSVKRCSAAKQFCQHGQYGHIVRLFCPKTCSVCQPARLFEEEEEEEDDYSDYASEEHASAWLHKLQLPKFQGAANDGPKFQGAFIFGAFAATALIVGMLGFGAWRMGTRSTSSRNAALVSTEEEDIIIELTDTGLE